MHFSKTYSQLLLSLPPELRESGIQYRQLKRLINQVVLELSSLGLSPNILHELITDNPPSDEHESSDYVEHRDKSIRVNDDEASQPILLPGDMDLHSLKLSSFPKIVYELVTDNSSRIEPHLRLWVTLPDPLTPQPVIEASSQATSTSAIEELEINGDDRVGSLEVDDSAASSESDVLSPLREKLYDTNKTIRTGEVVEEPGQLSHPGRTQEVIIPLVSDTEFFNMLSSAIEQISSHLSAVHSSFLDTLENLSRTISETALPASASHSFHPYSAISSHAGTIKVSTTQPANSDLYSWREIFQLYVEMEIFESVGEQTRGDRTVEESERRLKLFIERATQQGSADPKKFKLKHSRSALGTFFELNLFILNIKKLSIANSEATRKILKKHTKRTALPLHLPISLTSSSSSSSEALVSPHLVFFSRLTTTTLPRTLVQAIGTTLLPVIPHVDDYSCLICTNVAFKPIRLNCGHLFCVRCLVKMQKRNKANCPMCRAPVVLIANRSNVDWALLNFMQDWFPLESREKLKANEKEATEEEMAELGLDPHQGCVSM